MVDKDATWQIGTSIEERYGVLYKNYIRNLPNNSKILFIGAGLGLGVKFIRDCAFSENKSYHLIATDIREECIDQGKLENSKGIEWLVMDAKDINKHYKDSLDVVTDILAASWYGSGTYPIPLGYYLDELWANIHDSLKLNGELIIDSDWNSKIVKIDDVMGSRSTEHMLGVELKLGSKITFFNRTFEVKERFPEPMVGFQYRKFRKM